MKLIPNWVQHHFDRVVTPVANGLIVTGIHPNTLTTIGFLTLLASAVAFALGYVRLGGALLLLSGGLDMLDGKVARGGGMMSAFGAFYDSTLDRVGEAALFTGIAWYFMQGGVRSDLVAWAVLAAIVGLGAGLIVSYARARAEGLELECKVGIVQRAERIIGLGAPTMFFGAGTQGILLFGIVTVLALLSVFTVVQRVVYVYRITRAVPQEARATAPRVPALVDAEEGSSRE
jgi:CDP-diacylglycerol--glycerol-3-phosphate 3-phosphatidyltransferase